MADRALAIACGILAAWRVTCWLWREDGAMPVRAFLCRWPWAVGQVSCFWCLSAWVSLLLTPLVLWFWVPLLPLALSGAVVLLSGGGRIIWKEMIDVG